MYEDFYKLGRKPFQLSPDHRFFFNSSGHNRAMAYLRYGLGKGEGFIVITGGIGTGKSMLVANLFAELSEQDVVAAQLVSTQVKEDDLLRMVCTSFGLNTDGQSKAGLLTEMETFFRNCRAQGKRVLLVVDEAQNLPRSSIEELRMLSNFQHEGQALLQSFLIGQAELKRTLAGAGMEQVRQRIIAGYHLRALDLQEMRQYIEHRLTQAGWQGNPVLTEAAYERLHSATAGVPRRVNTLVDRLLLFGALEELTTLDAGHVDTVVGEVAQEVGHSAPARDESKENASLLDQEQEPVHSDLASRLEALEATVARMQEQQLKDRKLLKKAILLQMEIDADE